MYLINLLKKDLLNFRNFFKKCYSNNLIYKYKTESATPKDFSNYQNMVDLFINLRDVHINLMEVVKNQNNFKWDLGEIKKGNPNLKPKDKISVIQNVENFIDLR